MFYYRIQSPVIVIEFDHQRPVGIRHLLDASVPTTEHVHTVVRTPNGNDYGKDCCGSTTTADTLARRDVLIAAKSSRCSAGTRQTTPAGSLKS